MNGYRALVEEALGALRFHSPTSYSWHGEPGPVLPGEVAAAMDPETARAYLRHTLQNQLYADFYCRGRALPPLQTPALQPPHSWTPFVQSLSAANSGTGSREPGWLVLRAEDDGRVVVNRHGLTLWAPPGDVVGVVQPGAQVAITMPKELLRLSPGFYLALGNEVYGEKEAVVRFYWHVRSDGAQALVGHGTTLLNAQRVPFRLKVLREPASYVRCDAGVLYVRREDFEQVAPIVAQIYERVRGGLRPATPVLTKQLADGLGFAEDPPSEDSFGMERCGLLADAAILAHERGLDDPRDQVAVVEERFADAGVSLDAPYLNPGSSDEYEVPV